MLEKTSNFVRLKNETIERLKPYHLLKVDKENYPDVVKKRAELNKELGKVDKERKDLNKFVNASYQEITDLYKEALEIVDSKLESVENERRNEVLQEIMNAYASEKLPLSFDKVFDEKWLNRTVDWKNELRFKVNRIRDELAVAKKLDRVAMLHVGAPLLLHPDHRLDVQHLGQQPLEMADASAVDEVLELVQCKEGIGRFPDALHAL